MSFYCTNQTPSEFYHYTLIENVESIKQHNRLQTGDDGYLWGCITFEDIVRQFYATVLNPNYCRLDKDMHITKIANTNKSDYIILKTTPLYDTPKNWFIYDPILPPSYTAAQRKDPLYNPYALSIAYQGNLRIGTIETIQIP